MPTIVPGLPHNRNQRGVRLQSTETEPGHNQPKDLGVPILTAIDNIRLNCGEIAKLCRIARILNGLQQNLE